MKFIKIFLSFILTSVYSEVVKLSDENFASVVDGSTNVLVEFFAPWCGHCKSLAPEWELAGETFQPTDDIVIAALDATVAKSTAEKYEIKGYPTIKFFPKGSKTPEDYNGGRTAGDIIKWVNDKVGTNRKLKAVPSDVITLTADNFNLVTGKKAALVEFYAPWCGHCKSLAPTYEKLGKVFAGESDVVIAKIDGSEERELGERYDISGFPTLLWFPADSSDPIRYEQGRDLDSLINYINTQAGTARDSSGNLLPSAGRLESLDTIIQQAKGQYTAEFVTSLSQAIATVTAESSDKKFEVSSKLYLTLANKIVEKGLTYITNEIQRLDKMISSSSITPKNKTSFQLKQNILKAFLIDAE